MTLAFDNERPVSDPNLRAIMFHGRDTNGLVICMVSWEALRDRAGKSGPYIDHETAEFYQRFRREVLTAARKVYETGARTPDGRVLVTNLDLMPPRAA